MGRLYQQAAGLAFRALNLARRDGCPESSGAGQAIQRNDNTHQVFMKKTVIAALLAAASISAFASDYFVVVPVPNRSPTAGNILVNLNEYSLPSGVIGRAYAGFDFNSALQVLGDPSYNQGSVRWSVASGTLPPGLALSANGTLSGMPTAASNSSFQVLAAYKTKAGQQTYQVVVADIVVSLAGATLPQGVQGSAYSYDLTQNLQVTGDPQYTPAQVTWSLVSGPLPAGVQLNANGTLSGTPTAGGTFPLTVQASYMNRAGQRAYQVVVATVTVALSDVTFPALTAGTAYSYDLKQNVQVSGDPAYAGNGAGVTWSLASGALPAGLSLTSDGVISGAPTAVGPASFGVKAGYRLSSGAKSYSMAVNANVKNMGSFRAWSDGTYAATCQAYLSPSAPYFYTGATGDGVYRISAGGSTMDVYCNQTTNGGGWALLMKQAQGDSATLRWGTAYWTGTTLNDPSGANTANGNYVSTAFSKMPVTQLVLQAANESTLKTTAVSSQTAMSAMSDAKATIYSGDVAGIPQTSPNWSTSVTNYPNDLGGGTLLKQARFGFNFREQSGGSNGVCGGAKYGWAVDETSTAAINGCDDYAIGLGEQGGQAFQAWSAPTTYYLWGK
jgi:hypothetical protein